jgi:enediyne biosynthesis protein E4
VGKKLICIFFFISSLSVQGQQFVDVSVKTGIIHQFVPYQGTFGGGATIVDFNKDGYEDVFITGGMADDALYLNNKNGTFTNTYPSSGLKTSIKYVTQGAVSADVNKDGWPDLFITTITITDTTNKLPRAINLLFLNNGNGTFRNATKEFRLDKYLTFSTGACFGDINNDGYPDLFVSNYFHEYSGELNIMNDAMIVGSGQMARSYLFINKNGKSFKEVSKDYKIDFKGFGFGGVFTDYDNDGDADLIAYNDFGYKATPNFLYENKYPEKYFKDVSKEKNMKLRINGMGTAVGDVNNDGWLDYFFTNIRTNQFMINGGAGKGFINESMTRGTQYSFSSDSLGKYIPVSWGCNFADFDNDGDLDLFVACGSLNPSVEPNPDFYFENDNGKFINKAYEKGLLNRGIGRGSVVFDYDNDGDLDLLVIGQKAVSKEFGTESMTHLFRNDSSSGNWLKIILHGVDAESRGIGARVKVVIGNKQIVREIDGGSSHISQSTAIAHFGLGNSTKIDSIIINWPGGKQQMVFNLPVNRLIEITELNNVPKSKFSFVWIVIFTAAIAILFVLIGLKWKKKYAGYQC